MVKIHDQKLVEHEEITIKLNESVETVTKTMNEIEQQCCDCITEIDAGVETLFNEMKTNSSQVKPNENLEKQLIQSNDEAKELKKDVHQMKDNMMKLKHWLWN